MGKIKKILVAAFGVFTLAAVCTATAYAATEHLVGPNDDFQGVVNGAVENDTIKLIGSVDNIKTKIIIEKDLTIDLNGNTLSGEVNGVSNGLISVNSGKTLTIKDSLSGGVIRNTTNTDTVVTIYVNPSAVLNLNDVKIESYYTGTVSKNNRGVYVNAGTLTMNGGSIKAESNRTAYGVYLSGKATAEINNAKIEAISDINGGETCALFYTGSGSKATITGGTFTANAKKSGAAIGIKIYDGSIGDVNDESSKVTVTAISNASNATGIDTSGADISYSNISATSTGATAYAYGIKCSASCTLNDNNVDVSGSKERPVYKSNTPKVNISNGEYNVKKASDVSMGSVSVSGGIFNFEIKDYCAEGFEQVEQGGKYTVTNATAAPDNVSVQNDEKISCFPDIDEAIKSSNSESIITVLKDIETANAITLTNGAQLNVAEGATLTCREITVTGGTNKGTINSTAERVTFNNYKNEGIIISNGDRINSFTGCTNSGTITVSHTTNLEDCINTATGIIKDAKGITITAVSVENNGKIEGIIREGELNGKQHLYISDLDGELNGKEANLYTWNGEDWVASTDVKATLRNNGKHFKSYKSVSEAVNAVGLSTGETVMLMADCSGESISITKTMILDLNGHTITLGASNEMVVAEGKQLTIMDSKAAGTPSIDASGNVTGYKAGKITTAYKNYLIEVPNDSKLIVNSGIIELTTPLSESIMAPIMIANSIPSGGSIIGASNASVEINGGVVESTGYGIAVYGTGDAANPSSITVTNGVVKSYYPALLGNGGYHDTVMNVNGGELYSNDVTIYQPQRGILNITDGKITGKTGVEIRSGEINISGGEIITNAEELIPTSNAGGTTVVGAAVAVSQHTTDIDINVNISAGTFKASNDKTNAFYEKDLMNPGGTITMSVTGGDFTGTVESTDVPKFISGGTFTQDVQQYMTGTAVEQVKSEGGYTVYPSKDNVPEGTYKSAYAEGAASYNHVSGKLLRTLKGDETSVTFKVSDGTNEYSVIGNLPSGTSIIGTVSFALEVTDIPIGTDVTIE